jgi:hypothetical protein
LNNFVGGRPANYQLLGINDNLFIENTTERFILMVQNELSRSGMELTPDAEKEIRYIAEILVKEAIFPHWTLIKQENELLQKLQQENHRKKKIHEKAIQKNKEAKKQKNKEAKKKNKL